MWELVLGEMWSDISNHYIRRKNIDTFYYLQLNAITTEINKMQNYKFCYEEDWKIKMKVTKGETYMYKWSQFFVIVVVVIVVFVHT